MPEDIDVNRFALTALILAANAKRPDEYPDYETLKSMSDSGLVGFARGLLRSLDNSSPHDEVAAELKLGLRRAIDDGKPTGPD